MIAIGKPLAIRQSLLRRLNVKQLHSIFSKCKNLAVIPDKEFKQYNTCPECWDRAKEIFDGYNNSKTRKKKS